MKVYYQVAASVLDPATFEREIAPLKKVNDHYPKFILSMDELRCAMKVSNRSILWISCLKCLKNTIHEIDFFSRAHAVTGCTDIGIASNAAACADKIRTGRLVALCPQPPPEIQMLFSARLPSSYPIAH